MQFFSNRDFQLDELSGYSGSQLLTELRKQLIGRDLNVPTAEGESHL